MRSLYSLVLYLLTPFVFARLAWRGLRARGYWRRWNERLGVFEKPTGARPIWLHAVSVGETMAALPLVRAMLERYPDVPVVVTTTTPTGSAQVRAALGERVFHVYAPYDLPGAVARFLNRVRPRIAIVMETELWPNLYHQLHRRRVPILIANARLSGRSAAGYTKLGRLVRETLACVDRIAAQSNDDAANFLHLGADPERLTVTGNIKFDLTLSDEVMAEGRALRERLGVQRPVWIAASTHEGEEQLLLEVHAKLRKEEPELLLILVPRHPERFDRVAALCRRHGFTLARRSRDEGSETLEVYLGDTMGELIKLFAAADIAFVGGSLVPVGGHNLLEPAALGLPVLTGAHVFNFKAVTEMLTQGGGAQVVESDDELRLAVLGLLSDATHRQEVGAAAQRQVERNRGALERTLRLAEALLEPTRNKEA